MDRPKLDSKLLTYYGADRLRISDSRLAIKIDSQVAMIFDDEAQ